MGPRCQGNGSHRERDHSARGNPKAREPARHLWDTQTLLKALGGDGNEPATPDTAQQQALLRLLISCVPYPPDGLNSENPTDRAVALFEVLLKTQRDIAGMIADQDSEYDLVVYLKTPLEDLNLGLQDRASRFYPRRRRCCIK